MKYLILLLLLASKAQAQEPFQVKSRGLDRPYQLCVNATGGQKCGVTAKADGSVALGADADQPYTSFHTTAKNIFSPTPSAATSSYGAWYLGANLYTSGSGRTPTRVSGIAGSAILFDPVASTSNPAIGFYTNLPSDTATTSPTVSGSVTPTGAWTLGPPASTTLPTHVVRGAVTSMTLRYTGGTTRTAATPDRLFTTKYIQERFTAMSSGVAHSINAGNNIPSGIHNVLLGTGTGHTCSFQLGVGLQSTVAWKLTGLNPTNCSVSNSSDATYNYVSISGVGDGITYTLRGTRTVGSVDMYLSASTAYDTDLLIELKYW